MFDRESSGEEAENLAPLGEANGEASEEQGRCVACLTTWDAVRRDGRVGCAACYETFREALLVVMERVQRGESHTGKAPVAAKKRARRGENLRKRRENQLQLLENRLQIAVAGEKFEEAAALRAKIREFGVGNLGV